MKIAFCVFIVLCLIILSMVSSLDYPKSCAEFKIAAMKPFIKKSYVGAWFVHQLFDFPGSHEVECFVLYKTLGSDGNMNATQILISPDSQVNITDQGLATFNHPGEGRYIYTSINNPDYNGDEYIIIKTDYNEYSVEYSCKDVIGGSIVQLYAFTRDVTVSKYTQKQINKVFDAYNFDKNQIRTVNETSCPAELRKRPGLLTQLLQSVTNLVGGLLKSVTNLVGGLLKSVTNLLGGLLG